MPERDIGSLGAMGKGAGCGQEILPPPPQNSYYVLLENKNVYFWGIKTPLRARPALAQYF